MVDDTPVVTTDGLLDLERLETVLEQGYAVELGALTEGELYWLGPAAGGPVPDAPDQATLLAMSPDRRGAHLVEVAGALGASGALVVDDPDAPRRLGRSGPRAMVAALRGTATARTIVQRSAGGELVAIVHHLPTGADLVQRTDREDPGTHRFTCRGPSDAARWLAGVLDPGGDAGSTGAIRRESDVDDLDPDLRRLRAAPTAHTLLRVQAAAGTARALEVVAGPDIGVIVLRDFRAGSARQVVVQALGADDLVATCDALLHAHEDAGDGPVRDTSIPD